MCDDAKDKFTPLKCIVKKRTPAVQNRSEKMKMKRPRMHYARSEFALKNYFFGRDSRQIPV